MLTILGTGTKQTPGYAQMALRAHVLLHFQHPRASIGPLLMNPGMHEREPSGFLYECGYGDKEARLNGAKSLLPNPRQGASLLPKLRNGGSLLPKSRKGGSLLPKSRKGGSLLRKRSHGRSSQRAERRSANNMNFTILGFQLLSFCQTIGKIGKSCLNQMD